MVMKMEEIAFRFCQLVTMVFGMDVANFDPNLLTCQPSCLACFDPMFHHPSHSTNGLHLPRLQSLSSTKSCFQPASMCDW